MTTDVKPTVRNLLAPDLRRRVRHHGRLPLVLEALLGDAYRTVGHKAHDRPSSIKSLILIPPSLMPWLTSRRPAAARRAFPPVEADVGEDQLGHGHPRLVMVTSVPRATSASRALSLFFRSPT
jgi:hypothetical protein